MDRSRYPPDWEAISERVRFGRAGGRCECQGECGHDHGDGIFDPPVRCAACHGEPNPVTGSAVVLTVAHLDHDPASADEERLRAMCQRCHLSYDRRHRKRAHGSRQASLPFRLTSRRMD